MQTANAPRKKNAELRERNFGMIHNPNTDRWLRVIWKAAASRARTLWIRGTAGTTRRQFHWPAHILPGRSERARREQRVCRAGPKPSERRKYRRSSSFSSAAEFDRHATCRDNRRRSVFRDARARSPARGAILSSTEFG